MCRTTWQTICVRPYLQEVELVVLHDASAQVPRAWSLTDTACHVISHIVDPHLTDDVCHVTSHTALSDPRELIEHVTWRAWNM